MIRLAAREERQQKAQEQLRTQCIIDSAYGPLAGSVWLRRHPEERVANVRDGGHGDSAPGDYKTNEQGKGNVPKRTKVTEEVPIESLEGDPQVDDDYTGAADQHTHIV